MDKNMKWDNRFHVSPAKDNHRVHNRFREYFDKPHSQIERLSPKSRKKDYIEAPNLSSSLKLSTNRIPEDSRAILRNSRMKETSWKPNFQVTESMVNNDKHHYYKSFFGSLHRFNKLNPRKDEGLNVYLRKSPRNYTVKEREKAWNTKTIPQSFVNGVSHRFQRTYFETSLNSSFS